VGRHPDRHAVRAWHDLRLLPITVKHALSKVEGVSKTDVSFDKRQAVVTFDDAKTNVRS
jgi:hypothetical protein